MSLVSNLSEPVKHGIDYVSVGTVVGVLFSWLPQISALLAAIWFVLRIVIGVQEFTLNRRKLRK